MTNYIGDTIRIQATMTDFDDSILTPDSHVVTLYDPNGTQKDQDTSPSAEGGGVFHSDLTIPLTGSPGNWTIVWRTKMSDEYKFDMLTINVEEAP